MLKSPPDMITQVMDAWDDAPDAQDSPLPQAWKAGRGFHVSNGFDKNPEAEQAETMRTARMLIVAPVCCFLLAMAAVVVYALYVRLRG